MISPAPSNNTTLVLRRTFPTSRIRMFRAWTELEALEHWLRPQGMRMAVKKLDLRVGGSFYFDLENGHFITGTYLHIAPPEKLVFTWSGEAIQGRETIVTLDFLEQGSRTEVVLTHEGLNTPEMRAMFGNGWRSLFEELAALLSSDTTATELSQTDL